jgi:hypothetical protein
MRYRGENLVEKSVNDGRIQRMTVRDRLGSNTSRVAGETAVQKLGLHSIPRALNRKMRGR